MIADIKVKPIPKYMINKIYKLDKNSNSFGSSQNRFYCYFSKMKNKLVKITVAVRNKGKKWACKQVVVHSICGKNCIVKDMEYFYMGGYVVGWFKEGFSKTEKYYEDGNWYYAEDKYYDPFSICVNTEYALKFDKYKYSAIDKYNYVDYFKYLRIYEQYPIAEMLVKCDLSCLATSKTILKELTKNKKFRKWIFANRLVLHHNWFDKLVILKAFKTNQELTVMQQKVNTQKDFVRNCDKFVKEFIPKNEQQKFIEYISNQNTSFSSYADYLRACLKLEINMLEDKNKYPHDFTYWHDVRIDQYETKLAEEDKEKRKKLYLDFENVSNKYLTLQHNKNDLFVCMIAKSPQDLLLEGETLHHCVGKMNYDQKFAREESLIFFIRNKNAPNQPFVTLEYSLKTHKILQCYAEYNSKPNDLVLHFINKIWLAYANRKIKKLQI